MKHIYLCPKHYNNQYFEILTKEGDCKFCKNTMKKIKTKITKVPKGYRWTGTTRLSSKRISNRFGKL